MKKYYVFGIVLLFTSITLANGLSPYAGEENRKLKAMSASEVDGYLRGKGMGLAKAAELNGYPGPRHVLDLSKELGLTQGQIDKSNALFAAMQIESARLGATLIKQEETLDDLFASGNANHEKLEVVLASISQTRAKIRQSHLAAHIEQKKVLSDDQIALYIKRRGYNTAQGDHVHHSGHH